MPIWNEELQQWGYLYYEEVSSFQWLGISREEFPRLIAQEHLDNWFTYHSPSPEQIPAYQEIREAGKHLAEVILKNSPSSADQTDAIRSVRNACMTANAAIACEGR